MCIASKLIRLGCVIYVLIVVTHVTHAAVRDEVDLSGTGWKIWHDADASWEDDDLYPLPVDLGKLPVNPPTGGWAALDAGADAAAPGTAEQYLQKTPGPEGDITGVTWWTRTIAIPSAFQRSAR
jgi:hypothetical protein